MMNETSYTQNSYINRHLDLASKYIATIFDKYLGKINKKFKITPEEEEYVSENDSIDSEI